MSDTVTVVGILTPAVVGIAGLWFGAWREDRRLRWQTHVERTKELGDVLDDAGQAITEAVIAFERRRASPPDRTEQEGNTFDENVARVRLMDNRVTIRLGPSDPVAKAYGKASKQLNELSEFVWNAHGNPLEEPKAGDMKDEVEKAKGAFLDVAHEHAERAVRES